MIIMLYSLQNHAKEVAYRVTSLQRNLPNSCFMNFGICPLSVVPVRSSPSDKSEMISQLLFGETVEFLEKHNSWLRIRCTWDNYIGWIDAKQIKPISQAEFGKYNNNYAYSLELIQTAKGNNQYLPIPMGARLPDFDGSKFQLNGMSYTFTGQAISPTVVKVTPDLIIKIARRYHYAPYLWGGRSPLGIDCSGFTQMVFKLLGVALPRDSQQQVHKGKLIDFMNQTKVGDLAFFEDREGSIAHVGIIIYKNCIIHASGQVRIDKIDHYGVFNIDKQQYTHRLRVVKRIIPDFTSVSPARYNDQSAAI